MMRESDFVYPRSSSVDIDKSVKNKFRWQWLEEIDSNGDALSRYIRKLKEDGCAWCLFCDEKIVYSSSGKKAFIRHAGRNAHISKRKNHMENQPLPSAFAATRSKETGELRSSVDMPTQRPVTIQDRVSHAEALFCSFMAEHNLPHSVAPHLIHLCKELSRDPEALAMLSMERQTVTYKLKYGLASLDHKRLVAEMKATSFSINLDESTSKGNKKRVLNVLVCLFSEKLGKSVTHLYCSVEMTVVNSSTVFDAVMNRLREDDIPIWNLVSVLSDSAAYMRGEHTGFQAKLKEVAPHLLDVDGDVCHHIQNIVKKFSQELDPERHLEKLMDDLYRDFDLSADLRQDLGELCEMFNKPAKVPLERASHRWMSLYDACTRFLDLLEPLRLFYFSWLSVDDKTKFSSVTTSLLASVEKRERTKAFGIMRRLKGMALTQLGKARKARIASKLFHHGNKTLLLAHTISAVFPLFKSFITTFKQKQPMIHRLHDEMQSVFKHFLACFMKHEIINAAGKLHKIHVLEPSSHLPLGSVFCGSRSDSVLTTMPKDEARSFRKTLLSAYKTAAQYMQQKLPLQNTLLATLSALDPQLHGHSQAFISLMRLYDFFPTVCKAEEKDSFRSAASQLQLDCNLALQSHQLDLWWGEVLKLQKYKPLAPLLKACLSIFTGPRVEGSFSMMNAIITTTANRMLVSTYEAIQKQKYILLNAGKASVQFFHRSTVNSPVDPSLIYYMQTAASRMKSAKKPKKSAVPKLKESVHAQSKTLKLSLIHSPVPSKNQEHESQDPPCKKEDQL